MRKENSIINLIYAYVGQIFGVIISFVARIVFIKCLNSEYLGLNSLFTDIITFLSFAELGIGSAMTFSLYEPLAKNDTQKIKSLMNLYKIAYRTIGSLVFIIGMILLPFLPHFIKEMPATISNIQLYYALFVVNSAVSYFYSYKRSLVICDQKRYIATFYRYLFYFLVNLSQIILLWFTRNYLVFLVCQIVFTIFENIAISRKAEKMYPFLKEKQIIPLDKNSQKKIKRDIGAAFYNRVGALIIKTTDSLVISKFLGVVALGMYSNYSMIVTSLNTIINQIFTAITASVGNFAVTESPEKLKKLFDRIYFINFVIYGIISVCLFNVTNVFMKIWLGNDFLLDIKIVMAIIISFYIAGIRVSIITFKDALGLYWQDKYRPIITALVNLIVSVFLVTKIGILGTVLGTIISYLCVDLMIEPYFLYKYTLKAPLKEYYINYFKYFVIVMTLGMGSYWCFSFLEIENAIFEFLLKGMGSVVLSCVAIILLFYKTDGFQYLLDTIKVAAEMMLKKIKRVKEKET